MNTKNIYTLVFMLFAFILQAQTNEVEIYTADSKLFTVYIDGQQINNTPLSNVKFNSAKTEGLDFKIVFEENNTILEKKAVQMVSSTAKSSLTNGGRVVYQLTNNNGSYTLNQTSVTNKASSTQTKSID